ncbi:hypothetical protein J2125_003981 [Erwinia toletana]|uniref:Uncharacterized protein n=1 Tax=Winslowiella toletana TaxID=92490 RepID=A0ABS4PDT4_9GAMM|nr:hypothetical protein [Winslowiella toletana]
MSGNGRVVRATRRAGSGQCGFDFCGRVHRGPIPGQDGVKSGAERVTQLRVTRGGFF